MSLNRLNWLYIVGIGLAAGIFWQSFHAFSLSAIVWIGLLSLVLAVLGRGGNKVPAAPSLLFMGLLIFSVSLGLLRMEIASWSEVDPVLETKVGENISLNGRIVREPEERSSATYLYVKTEYGLILALADLGGSYRYGEKVIITGKLEKPEAFQTDLGRTFDYRGYLLAKGVSYKVSYAKVEEQAGQEGSATLARLFGLKHAFMKRIEALIPEPEAALGEGLLLGVDRALGDKLEDDFQKVGIIHIVVLSGYNLMIVAIFMLTVFGAVFGRRLSTIFGLVCLILFALLVGLSATVLRAAIMATLLLIMGQTGRVYLAVRGLTVAGIIMLMWNPYALAFDVGFQLSFLATLGLIVFSPHLKPWLMFVPNFFGARDFMLATLSTQLFVTPILLYQMGQLSIVAVVVNVLVLPMVATAMLFTFLSGLMAFLSTTLAWPLAIVGYFSLAYIINVAEWFVTLPFAAVTVPTFPFYFVVIAYAILACWLWRLEHPSELAGWKIVEVK